MNQRNKEITEKKKLLSKNSSVKMYKKVLNGTINNFPKDYWIGRNKSEGAVCLQYLLEVVLKWKESEFRKLSKKQIQTYKLLGMVSELFDGDLYLVMDYLYPNKYYPWDFKSKLKGYWTEETIALAIRSNIVDRGWEREDIIKNYNYKFVVEIGLEYAVKKIYKNRIYNALNGAFPNEYREWELGNVQRSFWTRETGIKATIWMINKLGWNREEIKKQLNKNTFRDMGLGGMLRIVYNNSPYDAINDAYPGEYKRYELCVPKGYWTKETGVEAVRHMIENELNYGREEVLFKLTKKDFAKCKLDYMVEKLYEGDYFCAIDAAYPGEYRRYELRGFEFRAKRLNSLVEYISFY